MPTACCAWAVGWVSYGQNTVLVSRCKTGRRQMHEELPSMGVNRGGGGGAAQVQSK